MRQYLLLIFSLSVTFLFGQLNQFSSYPDGLCIQDDYSFYSNQTGQEASQIEPGNNYGGHQVTYNPRWFYFEGFQPGAFEFLLLGSAAGVGYVAYGPFDSFMDMLNQQNNHGIDSNSIIINSSSSINTVGFIPYIEPNKFYLICIFSLEDTSQLISIEKTYGFGESTCDITPRDEIQLVSGNVFYDQNENGLRDYGEPGISNKMVTLNPFGVQVYTNGLGDYLFAIDTIATISYQVEANGGVGWNSTTMNPIAFTLDSINHVNEDVDFGFFPNKIECSGSSEIVIPSIQCVLKSTITVDLINQGLEDVFAVTSIEVDTTLDLIGLSDSASFQTQHSMQTLSPYINVFDNHQVSFEVLPNSPLVFGDSVWIHLNVQFYDTLGFPCTGIDTGFYFVVNCSYDPNDKTAYPMNYDQSEYVEPNGYIDYLINFENLGSASAVNIRIDDILSEKLDWTTFEKLSSSHDCRYLIDSDGMLSVYFDQILLSHQNPGNKGFFKYRIYVKENLLPLDSILNEASIYFDFNEPIITNTTITPVVCYLVPDEPILYEGDGFIQCDISEDDLEIRWYYNENELVDEFGISLPIQGYGTYIAQVRNSYGCVNSQTINYSNPEINDFFKVYPNPSSGLMHVETTAVKDRVLEIWDLKGNVVLEFLQTSFYSVLDLSSLNSGLYFVRMTLNSGRSQIEKIVISNSK